MLPNNLFYRVNAIGNNGRLLSRVDIEMLFN